MLRLACKKKLAKVIKKTTTTTYVVDISLSLSSSLWHAYRHKESFSKPLSIEFIANFTKATPSPLADSPPEEDWSTLMAQLAFGEAQHHGAVVDDAANAEYAASTTASLNASSSQSPLCDINITITPLKSCLRIKHETSYDAGYIAVKKKLVAISLRW